MTRQRKATLRAKAARAVARQIAAGRAGLFDYIPADLRETLTQTARRQGVPRSAVVEVALREGLRWATPSAIGLTATRRKERIVSGRERGPSPLVR